MPYSHLRGEATAGTEADSTSFVHLTNIFEKVTCMHYIQFYSTLQTANRDVVRGDVKENETVETIEKLSSSAFSDLKNVF